MPQYIAFESTREDTHTQTRTLNLVNDFSQLFPCCHSVTTRSFERIQALPNTAAKKHTKVEQQAAMADGRCAGRKTIG